MTPDYSGTHTCSGVSCPTCAKVNPTVKKEYIYNVNGDIVGMRTIYMPLPLDAPTGATTLQDLYMLPSSSTLKPVKSSGEKLRKEKAKARHDFLAALPHNRKSMRY